MGQTKCITVNAKKENGGVDLHLFMSLIYKCSNSLHLYVQTLILSAFAGKQSSTSTADPSGVVQGIPATADEDSIANLADEEDHITGAMATSHSSAPINHDEEMFKGN